MGLLSNLFVKKILSRRTRIQLNDLHQVYLIPFDQSGKPIDERLRLKDISLEGFAIRASLEEWGFTKGMELEANLHLWDRVFVVRFRFLHLHENFSGGSILKASDNYEEEFKKIFEPELLSLAICREMLEKPKEKRFVHENCGIQIDPEDFIFFYHNKLVRRYHDQIKILSFDPQNPLNFDDLNQEPETHQFELEELHFLMRFLLTFKNKIDVDVDSIASSLQERFRKELHASS